MSNNSEIVSQGKDTRFKPGHTLSRGHGRPPTKTISEALRKRLESGEADVLAAEMLRLAQKAKHESVRVAAGNAVADRVEGKPVQAHRVEASLDQDTAKRLLELAELLKAAP